MLRLRIAGPPAKAGQARAGQRAHAWSAEELEHCSMLHNLNGMNGTPKLFLVLALLMGASPALAAYQSNKITWGYVKAIQGHGENTSITLATAAGSRTLHFTPGMRTAITNDSGKAIKLDQLSLGDWVRVDFQADQPGSPREQDWILGVEDLSKPVQVNSAATSPVQPKP